MDLQKAENILFGDDDSFFKKAHQEGDIHPNGKWVWKINNGKGDWRVIREIKQSEDEKTGNETKNKTIEDYAKEANDKTLQNALKSNNNEISLAAKKELNRRKVSSAEKDEFLNVSDDLNAIKKIYKKDSNFNIDLRKLRFSKTKSLRSYEEDLGTNIFDQLDSIDYYLHSVYYNYKSIRFFLTHDEIETEKYFGKSDDYWKKIMPKIVKNISEYINENSIKHSLTLNRVLDIHKEEVKKFFTSLNVGDVFKDDSFVSVTLENPKSLSEYLFRKKRMNGETIEEFYIEILAKKGSSVASALNSQEWEYLIDKGSSFKVLEKSDNKIKVELL